MSSSAPESRAAPLTQGSIAHQVLTMAAPIAVGMVFQSLYFLVDLYFVGALGDAAIAGVSAAGNLTFIVIALTQVLAVGTVALVAQALGRRDRADAQLVFNQSLSLAGVFTVGTLLGGYALTPAYMRVFGADAATAAAGAEYLRWYLPGLALQFALVSMGAALRGTGIVKPAIVVQILTVVVNAILAPILIAGWGTGRPMGVAGAGLASTLSILLGVIVLWRVFHRLEHDVAVERALLRPQRATWARILRIGTPAGAEFLIMFVILAAIYAVIRPFGADAQAGFGIGFRINQVLFLPVMAIAFAAAPVAGQNYGARLHDRVRETFRFAAILCSAVMLVMTALCHWQPARLVGIFTDDPEVIVVGRDFLQMISWNYVASGLIFTCSGLFQALGNTLPSLFSSFTRVVTFVVPVMILARQPGFQLQDVWVLSVATTALQAVVSLWLLRREFSRKLVH
jgi:putative MATE family efflux protein